MREYVKIQTIFKRDTTNREAPIIPGAWTNEQIAYLALNDWYFTEKVNGENWRVLWDGQKRSFGGRTNNASLPMKLVSAIEELLPEEKLASVFPNGDALLFGEGFGHGSVAGSGVYGKPSFVLFDVMVGPDVHQNEIFHVRDNKSDGETLYLRRHVVESIAAGLDIQVVPIVGHGTLLDAADMVRQGLKSTWGDFEAEGLVMRPTVDLFDRRHDRLITKIKARDYRVLEKVQDDRARAEAAAQE